MAKWNPFGLFGRKSEPAPSAARGFGEGGQGVAQGYEAASVSRQTGDHWITRFSSADTEIYGRARTLRDKSRWLVRNNPFAAKAIGALTSNLIGTGIVPRPVTGSPKKDAAIRAAFDQWSFRADHAGQLDFYGLQTLLVREMLEGGEVLVRRRLRPRDKKRPNDVPLELQLLEADFLDPFRNGMLTPGRMAIQGVEIDLETQKRRAYWLWPQHPGNLWLNTGLPMVSAPVDAADVLHVYEPQRTQTRGVPWGTPAIESLNLLADYELAEIVRKKIEASVAGFVINAEDEFDERITPGEPEQPSVVDYDGKLIEKFEPGIIAYLRGGKDIKFNTPSAVGGYAEYKASQLQTIAAGYRVPYELISGDLSKVNFSSMRGGLVEFRRLLTSVQWQIIIQMGLQPIWEWWCEAAFLAGVIDEPYVPVEWAPPKFEWVDPKADADAAQVAVRAGFRSYQDVVSETGRNPDDVLDEIAAWNTKVDDLGIILDSDPRKTNMQGVEQPTQQMSEGEEPELSRPNRSRTRHGNHASAAGRPPRGKRSR